MSSRIGALIFQFEYLNRKKISCQSEFLAKLFSFFSKAPKTLPYALEPRNKNYLNKEYFFFLKDHDLSHVFLEGYYLPSVCEIFDQYGSYIEDMTIIRLHGRDREGMEERSGKQWNRIIESKDKDLSDILGMIKTLSKRGVDMFINVNNHYEGSAPLTMQKIFDQLDRD